jgi:CheY-like chemotaxis protein
MKEIPLKVLIVDGDESSARMLSEALQRVQESVLSVECATSLQAAQEKILDGSINTVYIDPLNLGLEDASKFIFLIRRNYASIVFVLYIDLDQAEGNRSEFFRGERRRFGHYFKLNKLTPVAAFEDELRATIRQCQGDLSYILTRETVLDLQKELSKIKADLPAEEVHVPLKMLEEIRQILNSSRAAKQEFGTHVEDGSVFLSYRFAEDDYVKGLRALLEKDGFAVVTGQDANTFISKAILDRIKSCQFFLCLMTKADEKADGTFTTSSWLLEEKGAALAFGKKIVLMVEDGVTDIGGLQGDWQRIHFTPKSFTIAAIRAVEQLKSYIGIESPQPASAVDS